MAQTEQIVVDIKFDTKLVEDARAKLAASITAVNYLKKAQAELNKTIKEQGYATKEQAAELADINKHLEEATRARKSNTAVLQAATQAQYDNSQSLDDQRQFLNTLQKAFASLTKEQMEMLGGQEHLQEQIKAVSDSLKEQEHAIGEDGRNVGNYAESITKAFGDINQAAGALSPAIGILRGMGPEGQKAAAALDMLGKTMQIAGKAGQILAASHKAQAAATQGQTVAQEGLNVAMAANPVGLIIAGITTLLPLIQAFCSAVGDASKEQAGFNNELERQNYLIEQAQKDAELEAELAQIAGASAQDVINIRRKEAAEAEKTATEEYQRLLQISKDGNRKERKAAGEALEEAKKQMEDAQKRVDALNKAATLQEARDRKAAEDERRADAQKRKETRVKEVQDEQAALNAQRDLIAQRERSDLENSIKALEEKRDKELEIIGLSNEERLKIQQYYDEQIDALRQEDARKAGEAERAKLQAQQDARVEFGLEEGKTPEEQELERAQAAHEQGLLDDEQYEQARTAIKEKYAKQREVATAEELKHEVQQQRAIVMANAQATSQLLGSLTGLLDQFGEENRDAALASKAIALGKIAVDTGIAIAGGVAQAQSVPFPANIAAIATTIATVIANMASAISTVKGAKFASGGIVGGTSYTGDQVNARLNSGEMVLNKEQQTRLFDAVSGGTNGSLGFNYELMAQAMSAQPAPVMDYEEFKSFEQDVTTYKELASV